MAVCRRVPTGTWILNQAPLRRSRPRRRPSRISSPAVPLGRVLLQVRFCCFIRLRRICTRCSPPVIAVIAIPVQPLCGTVPVLCTLVPVFPGLFFELDVTVYLAFQTQAQMLRTGQEAMKRPSKSDSPCSIILSTPSLGRCTLQSAQPQNSPRRRICKGTCCPAGVTTVPTATQ
jgi:hypothetical protein